MSIKTGNIIDQHRPAHVWTSNKGRTIECLCGHEAIALYEDQISPITDENNPQRVSERAHADHVANMLELADRDIVNVQWDAEKKRQRVERVSPLGTPGVTFRAVERSTAIKYQIQTFEREYPELVVKDLLKRAAHEIGKHEEIPAQIKIDRAPAGQGEKITVTWFA